MTLEVFQPHEMNRHNRAGAIKSLRAWKSEHFNKIAKDKRRLFWEMLRKGERSTNRKLFLVVSRPEQNMTGRLQVEVVAAVNRDKKGTWIFNFIEQHPGNLQEGLNAMDFPERSMTHHCRNLQNGKFSVRFIGSGRQLFYYVLYHVKYKKMEFTISGDAELLLLNEKIKRKIPYSYSILNKKVRSRSQKNYCLLRRLSVPADLYLKILGSDSSSSRATHRLSNDSRQGERLNSKRLRGEGTVSKALRYLWKNKHYLGNEATIEQMAFRNPKQILSERAVQYELSRTTGLRSVGLAARNRHGFILHKR